MKIFTSFAVAVASVACLLPLRLEAQAGGAYKKKVVTFVDRVVVPRSSQLTAREMEYIRSSVDKAVRFERFNNVALPDTLTASFARGIAAINEPGPETVRPVIDQTLAPSLLGILDLNKELLSRQNLTEEERNTFLATKAKAAGLSAAELENVLNSGFFYVPFVAFHGRSIDHGYREIKNEKGKVIRRIPWTEYTHRLKLGILWYRLSVDQSNTAKTLYVGVAEGWSDSPVQRSSTHEDEDEGGGKLEDDGSTDFSAFKSAVDVSCLNIGNETKKMEAFQLSGEVTDASFFGVHMNLGTKEGVGLDDTYWVEEFQETESGDIVKNKRGFVKVREVGDNRTDEQARSYAQTITGSDYSRGLSVTELPLLGINGLAGGIVFPVSVGTFDNRSTSFLASKEKVNFSAVVKSESKQAVGAMLAFQTDLAKASRVSELWLSLGGAIGVLSVDGKFYNKEMTDSADIGASLSGYVNLGLVKKFYIRRFGFFLQADLKYALTQLSASGNDGTSYKLTHSGFGADGKGGLEVYLNPRLSIGAGAEYNLFGTGTGWTALYTDKDNAETKNSDASGPPVKYGGLSYALWFNYSLPSLR